MAASVEPPECYKVREVAKLLHVGERLIWTLIETGQLRSVKFRRTRRITADALREFLAAADDTTEVA
jgi:excisionase family DNA binding protein